MLSPTILLKFPLNMLFKYYSIIGSKFGPPQYRVTDRSTEYFNQDMTLHCFFFINHSPRTPNSAWTNGLVEAQNRNLGIHLRLFLQNLPDKRSFQTQLYAYARNTTLLPQLKLPPHQLVFHTHPRTPLTFSLNLTRDSSKSCSETYCNSLPPHTHYSGQDLNPLFQSILTKPISPWLLSAEHAMLENYSSVHRHFTNELNSQSSTFETTHLKQLPLDTFVIHTNFKPVKFSHKIKPLRLGPNKNLQHLSDVTYELMARDGSTFHIHGNHIFQNYPKEPPFFHFSVNIIQHPLFSITLILNRIKIFILPLIPLMIIIHLNNFNRTPLLNPLLSPNKILTFLLHTKTSVILLFHTINFMISQTLLTLTPKCSIIIYIIPLPFHKHSLVLLTRLKTPTSPTHNRAPILGIIHTPSF